MKLTFSYGSAYSTSDTQHEVVVASLQEAQIAYIAYRDENMLGASQLSPATVTEDDGTFVARISYNGRAWAGTSQDDAALVAEAPKVTP